MYDKPKAPAKSKEISAKIEAEQVAVPMLLPGHRNPVFWSRRTKH